MSRGSTRAGLALAIPALAISVLAISELTLLVACASEAPPRAAVSDFVPSDGMQEIRYLVDGVERRATLFAPPGRDPHAKLPLIVYLHGMGERGDAQEHVRHGLGKAIAAAPERFRGFVLMPQCPKDQLWVAADQAWARGLADGASHIDAALDWAFAKLPVDREHVTLTGLSMGGFGTLIAGARRAADLTALCAICGGGRVEDAAVLATRPVWLVHGDADRTVPVEQSRRIADAIRAVRADAPLRLTEYPGVGHNSWDRAYADPALIEFLFSGELR